MSYLVKTRCLFWLRQGVLIKKSVNLNTDLYSKLSSVVLNRLNLEYKSVLRLTDFFI